MAKRNWDRVWRERHLHAYDLPAGGRVSVTAGQAVRVDENEALRQVSNRRTGWRKVPGYGRMRGSEGGKEFPFWLDWHAPGERIVRSTLVSTIYGGTSEIQREIIAKTLGL